MTACPLPARLRPKRKPRRQALRLAAPANLFLITANKDRHDAPVRRNAVLWIIPLGVAILATAVGLARASDTGLAYVIRGDTSIGGVHLGRTTAPQAAVKFESGGARSLHRRPNSCLVSWPRIGLAIDFGTLGSDPTDPCHGGTAFVATVTSRSVWRTAVGLRVGDNAKRLRQLYPHAQLHLAEGAATGYWLVVRHTCAEVGGSADPGLLARVQRGHVTAFVGSVGICD